MESMAMKNITPRDFMSPELEDTNSISPKTTEKRVLFPERLWESVNDPSDLIRWSSQGDSVLVAVERFEKDVMNLYPGLVAISSFSNFRRQMRVYNFECLGGTDEEVEFSHPYFLQGHPELVCRIQTKRKSVGTPGHGDSTENTARVYRRKPKREEESDETRGTKEESNTQEGQVKTEGPKRKRRYMRKRRRDEGYSGIPHGNLGMPGFHPRPPAPPFCSCPWHCPVTWDSYETMMQGWAKYGPPPGYWYPPPPPLQQPKVMSDSQTIPVSAAYHGTTVRKSQVLPVKQPTETNEKEAQQADENAGDETSTQIKERNETQGLEETDRDLNQEPYPTAMIGSVPPMAYPMGPDPWRFHQPMGGMPFYPPMAYGGPVASTQGHQPYHNQHYHPQMPYPYAIEPVSHGHSLQTGHLIAQQGFVAKDQKSSLPARPQQTNVQPVAVSQSSDTTARVEDSNPDEIQVFQTIDEQMVRGTLETNEQTGNVQEVATVAHSSYLPEYVQISPAAGQEQVTIIQAHPQSISTVPQYLSRGLPANCEGGFRPKSFDKQTDQVSTEELITNVGIQQHNMMVLMNQHHQEDDEDDLQTWEEEELCNDSQEASTQDTCDGQTWEHQQQQQLEVHAWQQQQQQHEDSQEEEAHQIEHWVEDQDRDTETIKADDVMLEVEVESQGSQCSGPLDLSSAEVTIVTMDQNIPVRIAAVVQDDD